MKNKILKTIIGLGIVFNMSLQADDNLKIKSAQVEYIKDLDLLVFS